MTRFLPALLLALLAAPARAGDLANGLPEKTAFYLSLDDVARSRERFGKSGFAALWRDDGMQKTREAFEAAMKKKDKSGVSPFDFLEVATGQAVIAIIPVGQQGYAALGLVEIEGKQREFAELLRKVWAADERESRETEEEFRGHTITTRRTLEEGQEEPESDYYVVGEKLFAISDDLDALKDFLVRHDGGEGASLGKSEAFVRTMAATGERCDMRAYVPASLWRREGGMLVAPVLMALGLDGVQGVGAHASFRDEGVAARIVIHQTGEARGLMKVLGGNVDGLAPAKLLPADVDPAMAWSIDWQFLYQEVLRVMGMFDAQSKQQFEAQVGMFEQELGFKLEADLLASLAPGLSYAVLPIPEAESADAKQDVDELVGDHLIVLQKLRNKEMMTRILSKLAKMEGMGFKESEYLGATIWDDGDGFVLSIVGEHLVMGGRVESVQTIIRREGKQLQGYADTEHYKAAQGHLPAKRSMIVVSGRDDARSSFYWYMMRRQLERAGGAELTAMMPEPAVLEKYFGVNVFSMSLAEPGLFLDFFWTVRNPEAK